MSNQVKIKPYKEEVIQNISTKDYTKQSSQGDVIPTNRVKVDLVEYTGEYAQWGKAIAYKGEKIRITLSKLQLQDGQYVIKQKTRGNYIVNDETVLRLTEDEASHLAEVLSEK